MHPKKQCFIALPIELKNVHAHYAHIITKIARVTSLGEQRNF